MTFFNSTLKAAFVLVAVGLFAQSVAAESTTFHPSQCQSAFDNDGERIEVTTSGLANRGSNTVHVTCPLDVPINREVAFANMIKQGNVYCRLERRNPASGQVRYGASTTLGSTQLYFYALDRASTYDTYSMFCWVPPQGVIKGYRVDERNF